MGILYPVDPRALFLVVLKYVGAKSGPTKEGYYKKAGHQSSHQTFKYHQYAVGTSLVPPAALRTPGWW